MNTPSSRIDRLVNLAADLPFHPPSKIAVQLAALLEDRRQSVNALADLILSDIALTQQILRTVNSAASGLRGEGKVTSVAKALHLLGFDQIRRIALALEMLRQQRAEQKNGPYERACLHGMRAVTLARTLAPAPFIEQAVIVTLIRASGAAALALVAPAYVDMLREQGDDQRVAERLARNWGLPDELTRCVSPPGERAARVSVGSDEYHRALSLYCLQIASRWDSARQAGAPRAAAQVIATAAEQLRLLTAQDDASLQQAIRGAMQESDQSFGTALGRAPLTDVPDNLPLEQSWLAAEFADMLDPPLADSPSAARLGSLTDALADVRKASQTGVDPRLLSRMLVDAIHRAMHAEATILYLSSRDQCLPYQGAGLGDEQLKRRGFQLDRDARDPIQRMVAQQRELLLSDIAAFQASQFLPAWLAPDVGTVRSLLILPAQQQGKLVGLLVAYGRQAVDPASQEEIDVLSAIRDQFLQLFKAAMSGAKRPEPDAAGPSATGGTPRS